MNGRRFIAELRTKCALDCDAVTSSSLSPGDDKRLTDERLAVSRRLRHNVAHRLFARDFEQPRIFSGPHQRFLVASLSSLPGREAEIITRDHFDRLSGHEEQTIRMEQSSSDD